MNCLIFLGDKMAEYTLYVDESTIGSISNSFFCMGGVIINKKDYDNIEDSVNELKLKIWDNISGCENFILHEKDISFASNPLNSSHLEEIEECNRIFVNNDKVVQLYNGLSKIFKNSSLATIGVCLNRNKLNSNYGSKNMNHNLSIAIQILIENYCNFLYSKNSTGDICYEFMQPGQNMQIQQRIYELKALGSLYYSPNAIQSAVREIDFQLKTSNVCGLQLADFVPNTLGRSTSNKKPKHRDFAKNVRSKLYKGNTDEPYKYGYKILS